MVRKTTPKISRKIGNKPEGGLGELPPTGGQYEGKHAGADRHIAILQQSVAGQAVFYRITRRSHPCFSPISA